MAPRSPSRTERAALCDLFLTVGPDAPTLCEGWTTYDLAVHLLVRERNPLAGPGIALPGPPAALTARIMARTKARRSYSDVVRQVSSGPPPWTAPLDSLINTVEYFVHHEDVRRGAGDDAPRPVAETVELDAALWRSLRKGAGLMARSLKGTGLDLVRPDGAVIHARRGPATATLTGTPGEVTLFLSGRAGAAHVELGGPDEAVARLRGASFGL